MFFFNAAALLSGCTEEAAVPGPVEAGSSPDPQMTIVVAFTGRDTPSPAQAPAPTSVPAPEPTPTPGPEALLADARQAAFNGDDATAAALYTQLFAAWGQPDTEPAFQARLEQARSLAGSGDTPGAIATLAPVAVQTLSTTLAADAQIWLGKLLVASKDPAGAIAHYTAALSGASGIDGHLNLWLGEAHLDAGQPISALAPLQKAVDASVGDAQEFARREKLALAHQLAGQYDQALSQYDAILSGARIPSYRARMLWESSQVLLAMDQPGAAYQRMREVMTNTPNTPSAFNALNALLDGGQSVDELQRGIVDYHNGAYAAAREAFKRAIQTDSRLNEIRYWAALNYLKLESTSDAFRNLDQIIASGPGSPRYGDAVVEKGDILSALGNLDEAVAAYRLLPATAPGDAAAPTALYNAARALERANRLDEAAQAALSAQAAYPGAETAAEMLVRGAIALYRLGRYGEAISATQAAVSTYPAGPYAGLAQLWLGKAQLAAGDVVSGQAALQSLAEARPDEYEGTRAAEILSDWPTPLTIPFEPAIGQPVSGGANGGGAEGSRAEAENWLRAWLNISDTVDVGTASTELQADARFQSGNALWQLGFQSEAREEFESLRASYTRDPLASYQLALHLGDIGLYRSSIGAADTLMRLSPAGSVSGLPAFIASLLYPRRYAGLVERHAREFGLDPLLVYSLIRQESLFEPFAASSASAYGLMQVIPPTGQEINRDLDWPPGYTARDLVRPFVSARFGTYYLAKQRRYLEGDLYAALAAYNGGPGNSRAWKDRSGGDPDAFYMAISFEETQRYIRAVATNYAIYHRLYGDR